MQTNEKNAIQYTIKYALINGSYWPIYCASYSFASVFLLSRSFSNAQIGILLAVANIIAVFLQPAIASFADMTKKISLHRLTSLLAGIALLFTISICLIPDYKLLLAILLTFELTLLFSLQPLCNALGMEAINQGVHFNFGLARGIGSISFAVFSSIIGVLIAHFGPDVAPVAAAVMFVLFIIFTYTFLPASRNMKDTPFKATSTPSEQAQKPLSVIAFAKKYRRFVILLAAVTITFCAHTMINNYFIQIVESIGGNTKDMGTAIGLAAAIELPAMAMFTFLVKKIRCSTILRLSFFFFFVKTVLTFFATNMTMIYIAQLFQFFAYAMFIPASIYYVNQVIGKNDLIKGQAFMTGAVTLSGVIASLLGGMILDGPGVRLMLFLSILCCAIGMVLCMPAIEKTCS